jgi:hypothetical protein
MSRKAKVVLPVGSSEVSAKIVECFSTLHALVVAQGSEHGVDTGIPAKLEECDAVTLNRVTQLARSMQVKTPKEKSEGAVGSDSRLEGLRGSVTEFVQSVVSQCLESKAAYATSCASMPEVARNAMPEFPKTTNIPMSQLTEFFPGAEHSQVMKDLRTLGFKIGWTKLGTKHIIVQVWE